jgi:epoxyqueuosine reductase QueG
MSPQEWIAEEIERVMDQWIAEGRSADYWRRPVLVGIASAEDPLFNELPRVAAPDHAFPGDLLADARSVVVFFLPFQKDVVHSNKREPSGYASRTWAEAYVATNSLIGRICDHLQDRLAVHGHRCAVTPATHNFDEERLVSRWSHKHLAYIAGLGTFGVHHQLITRAGCCGRLGSFVTSAQLPPSRRPDAEFCLVKAGKECGKCVSRCVYGALREDGFDRHLCYARLLENDRHYADLPLVDVCGKCAADVPCSYAAPSVRR